VSLPRGKAALRRPLALLSAPRTDRSPLESDNEPPPEPGFARREAHNGRDKLKQRALRRLRARVNEAAAGEEGVRGGTGGSPTL
jgi:hypothetical protein